MEKPHTPLPGDPRYFHFNPIDKWEEGVEEERYAKMYFEVVENRLQDLGITIPRDEKILEVGSGAGVMLRYLQKIGFDAVGVDARPRGEKTEKVVRARIEQLPFPDETFGLLFAYSVFDSNVYRQDQPAMLGEIYRVLKHGGLFVDTLNHDDDPAINQYFEALSKSDHTIGKSIYRKK
jgi:ubiquinone/menaquinone biosynthesis C-methylase UbiE